MTSRKTKKFLLTTWATKRRRLMFCKIVTAVIRLVDYMYFFIGQTVLNLLRASLRNSQIEETSHVFFPWPFSHDYPTYSIGMIISDNHKLERNLFSIINSFPITVLKECHNQSSIDVSC